MTWEFDSKKTERHIGVEAAARIQILLQNLYGQQDVDFRVAPSIICRSEIEMLGLSAPRFAYWTKVESDEGIGFLSVRRIDDLKAQLERTELEGWSTKSDQPRQYSEQERKGSLEQLEVLLQQSQPLAECILPTPNKLWTYQVNSSDYTNLFGLLDTIRGTPYINAIQLGGGVCAQAVVFIASLMMHKHASGILCPSELTALVQGCFEGQATNFIVKGFAREEFPRVFRNPRIGLQSRHELALFDLRVLEGGEDLVPPTARDLAPFEATRSYVQSGFPVILVADGTRYVDALNRISGGVRYSAVADDNALHSVLVVGCDTKRRSRFLVHDPLTTPFIEFTEADLARSMKQSSPSQTQETAQWNMFAVLPDGVELPLLKWKESKSEPTQKGLFALQESILSERREALLAARAWTDSTDNANKLPTGGKLMSFGRLRLIQSRQLVDADWESLARDLGLTADEEDLSSNAGKLLHSFLARLIESKATFSADWIWIQTIEHRGKSYFGTAWVWDATKPIVKGVPDVADHLLEVFECETASGDDWQTVWQNDRTDSAENSHDQREPESCNLSLVGKPTAAPKCAQLSIITSVLASRLEDSMECISELSVTGAELYCFMQTDASWLKKILRSHGEQIPDEFRKRWWQVDLQAFLSWIGEEPGRIDLIADRVVKMVGEKVVMGLASYLPEISLPPTAQQRNNAVGALRTIVKLAIALRERKQPVTSIEFVGGSRCVGIDWEHLGETFRVNGSKPEIVVGFVSYEQELSWILESLKDACRDLTDQMNSHNIVLSAELEPGELNTLSSPSRMLELIEASRETPGTPVVTANFDVGHFCLARAAASNTQRFDESVERLWPHVSHCHLTVHSPYKGHFRDCPVDAELFDSCELAYLDRYQRECNDTARETPISRYVSVELEAAESYQAVQKTVQNSCYLLGIS